MLSMVFLIFAFVLFMLAGFVSPVAPNELWRSRLCCFGLACMAAAEIIMHYPVVK